ncbi:MAG TPA: GNAT family N-acetyltransferase [Caulobacteraceae bacterium]
MDVAAVLALFDATMRADPPQEIGVTSEWSGEVLRRLGPYNFIEWWTFGAQGAHAAVAREAAHFRASGGQLEWKVHGHDRPGNLEEVLARAGFEPDEPETLLAFDLVAPAPATPRASGPEVRRVTDRAGLADLLEVNAAAFGQAQAWQGAAFAPRLGDPTLGLYIAYAEGRPGASGRLEMPHDRVFAGLYGGGTAPGFRGRGAYRALVGARAEEARRQGYRYLIVDAAETSRPILERLGFEPLAEVRGWRLGE